jgi:hypothetical protein
MFCDSEALSRVRRGDGRRFTAAIIRFMSRVAS